MTDTNTTPTETRPSDADVRKASVSMDPRLQKALALQQCGVPTKATASSAPSEVPVIAKVTSETDWEGLSEVRCPIVIAGIDNEDKTSIVTGRIPVSRIEHIRALDFVVSLKAAQPIQPTLSAAVGETNSRPDQLPSGSGSNGGAGVVVGIVDYGCDFAHRNFLNGAGKTRLVSIWHQGGSLDPIGNVPYGREYSADDINAALGQAKPYDALGYGPAPDTAYSVGSHGTHVMDIAAGNGFGSGVAGFAPSADLIFVDVAHRDIAFSGPEVIETSFGDSVMLLEAIAYIFDKAGDRPCVINISLGTNGGPHDGSTPAEQGIDRLISQAPNRAVTISASNSHADGIHASGQVPQSGFHDLVWQIPINDFSHNELEVWYSARDDFEVEVIAPNGESIVSVPSGYRGVVPGEDGLVQLIAVNRVSDPNNGDNMINVFLEPTAPAGDWVVRVHGRTVQDGMFHAWIERDNARPSSFAPPHDNSHTIGSISCGRNTIVVGSYDARKPKRPISYFSSEGPTRDGREKPEVSAPGHAVYAAHSRTGTEVVSKSGTSMASPAVAGIVALMLGEARANSVDLKSEEIRDLLFSCHRWEPPVPGAWDARYGLGRVDGSAAVAAVMAKIAGASTTAKS